MKWYFWLLIAAVLIGVIYVVVTKSKNSGTTTLAQVANQAPSFDPYHIIPVSV